MCPASALQVVQEYSCQLMAVLCEQVFQINPWRAWGAVATSVAAMAFSLYLIAVAPWYLLPFAWVFSGTAFTGVGGPLIAAAAASCGSFVMRKLEILMITIIVHSYTAL